MLIFCQCNTSHITDFRYNKLLIDIKNDFEILNFAFKICKVVPLRPEDHRFNP